MEKNKEFMTLKEVCRATGLSADLVRLYCEEFSIPVQRTDGGHRRFTQENLDMLFKVKKKIQEEGWSYKEVSQWLNGGVVSALVVNEERKTAIEERLENIEKALALVVHSLVVQEEGKQPTTKIDSLYNLMQQLQEQTSQLQIASAKEELPVPQKELNWIQRQAKKIFRL